ncbi:neurocan core protein [Silurus meridionalis]|nr:neurocan core protein [Silurus meridionalis]
MEQTEPAEELPLAGALTEDSVYTISLQFGGSVCPQAVLNLSHSRTFLDDIWLHVSPQRHRALSAFLMEAVEPLWSRWMMLLCGPPPPVDNAFLIGRKRSHYDIHSVVRYQCADGFLQRHVPTTKCRASGKWDHPKILCTKYVLDFFVMQFISEQFIRIERLHFPLCIFSPRVIAPIVAFIQLVYDKGVWKMNDVEGVDEKHQQMFPHSQVLV